VAAGTRIAFLINSMDGGGAERAMANLLGHLMPHLSACDIEMVLLDDLPRKQTLPEGLRTVTLDGRGSLPRSFRGLSRHWSRSDSRPDLCISFLARANVLNVVLARRFGHKAIISERVHTSSHIAGSRAEPVIAWMTRKTYPKAAHVIAVSAGVADDLAGRFEVPRSRMSVIGNPVDSDRLARMAGDAPATQLPGDYYLGVGRLVPNKNFNLLIEAFAASGTQASLVLLGQGPELDRLRDRAVQLGVGDRVQFAGFLENPYPVMARARALVSASRAEGFPNTLIEAMSLGCPVIATDCPSGPADVLACNAAVGAPWPTGAHGLLVPMEHRDAMAAAIRVMDDDAARQGYAAKAARRACDFGHAAVTQAYFDLIASLQGLSSRAMV
jgi:N-acetylgalactosamine-N,N'-diacetylbacillosaminyl-diphospho-undecaprenol 4-alpha-N-acetylgalactosaminyltransferase